MSKVLILYCPHHNEYYVEEGTEWPVFDFFKCDWCRRQNESYSDYVERLEALKKSDEIDRGMPLNGIVKQAFNEWRRERNFPQM